MFLNVERINEFVSEKNTSLYNTCIECGQLPNNISNKNGKLYWCYVWIIFCLLLEFVRISKV